MILSQKQKDFLPHGSSCPTLPYQEIKGLFHNIKSLGPSKIYPAWRSYCFVSLISKLYNLKIYKTNINYFISFINSPPPRLPLTIRLNLLLVDLVDFKKVLVVQNKISI